MRLSFLVLIAVMFEPLLLQAGELTADHIHRDPYGMVSATGQVQLQANDYHVSADELQFDMDAQSGDIKDGRIRFDSGFTLKGSTLHRIDLESFKGENVEFSSCPEDEWAWSLHADEAKLDREEGTFHAKGAWFEWGGVPVLYTPVWNHALKRNSGFLMPKISQSTRRGIEYTIPFYWAGAPNWDMTLSPHWMSLRGMMSDIEWRHRSSVGSEELQIQSIFDKQTQAQRSRIRSDMSWQATDNIDVALKLDAVEDGLHVADFPLARERESTPYLSSSLSATWRSNREHAILSSSYQQVLGGGTNATTLQIMPRLQTRHYLDVGLPQEIQFDHQTTVFQRDIGTSGLRVGLRPTWSLPWQMQGGAVSARWSVLGQFVSYDSSQFTSEQSSYGAMASSLEFDTVFERVFEGKQWRHEIKPVLRFDVSNTPNQNDQPQYDSNLAPLTMSNLMTGNRYSGWDRFERMRKVSMMLVSSLQKKDEKGYVRTVLQGQVGMAWDDLQESVDTTIVPTPDRRASNLLAELSWAPVVPLSVSVGGQRDSVVEAWVESHAGFSWQAINQQYFTMAWRRTTKEYAAEAESLNTQGKVNMSSRWSAHMATDYDLLNDYVLSMTTGVAYQHACWQMSLERFETYNVGSSGTTDVGARFLLEFDGLGSFGG
ncbi:MAG: LPS assembly protein LptD [Ghiorsea sp.]